MGKVIQYTVEDGIQNRVEYAQRGKNLILQLFPKRPISTEEAMQRSENAPTVKIIQCIDQYNPKHIKTNITVPNDKMNIPFYTIEFKEFYELPTDTDYLRGKIIKALNCLSL